ncbi:MAG: hypothetical protein M5U34_01565 [Chloroflexi bacterium]|nr:hypothetical protein [Chloroflexota bacterium]
MWDPPPPRLGRRLAWYPKLTPLPVKTAEPTETAVPPELEEKQKAFLNDLENQLETEKSQPPAKKRGGIFIASETLSSPEPIVEITDTGVVKPKNIPVKTAHHCRTNRISSYRSM